MATKTYYAWGPILYGSEVDQKTGVRNPRGDKYINVGEEVTAKDLGIDDDEFNALIESGAVRTQKYPDDIPEGYQGSPIDWLKLKAQEAADQAVAGVASLQTNANEPTVTEDEKDKTSTPPNVELDENGNPKQQAAPLS